MKRVTAYLFLLPLLCAVFFFFNSFGNMPVRQMVTGSGRTTDNVEFRFRSIQNNRTSIRQISYGTISEYILCVAVSSSTATMYFSNEGSTWAITVIDGKDHKTPDQISEPFPVDVMDCHNVIPQTKYHKVMDGDIQVN